MYVYFDAYAGLDLISELNLHTFRNHKQLNLNTNNNIIVIQGDNGAGKTNILEAISLLAPGKGIRNANFDNILPLQYTTNEWAVNAQILIDDDYLNISTGCVVDNHKKLSKRVIKINDEIAAQHSEVLNYLKILWITPQTEKIFIESSSLRRKFVDRMTYNFLPNHVKDIVNYEKLIKSRLRLLHQSKYDDIWITNLEKQIAHLNYVITNNRMSCIESIINVFSNEHGKFLKPIIKLIGKVEELFTAFPDMQEAISVFQDKLRSNRTQDKYSNRTNFGTHKSDLQASHPSKHTYAFNSSTAEQKAMLISIILAQAKVLRKSKSLSLVLLFDEVFAHLDRSFRYHLINEMIATDLQVWLTTANSNIVNEINCPIDIINL